MAWVDCEFGNQEDGGSHNENAVSPGRRSDAALVKQPATVTEAHSGGSILE
jgi:hypothetical protein